MDLYAEALEAADRVGSAHASETQLLAQFCRGTLPYVAGAVSPKLVFEGALAAGLNSRQLAQLCHQYPLAVAELQWSPAERNPALAACIAEVLG
jgi:hypothetical protein